MKRGVSVLVAIAISGLFCINAITIKHLDYSSVAVEYDGLELFWCIEPPLSPHEGRWVNLKYKGRILSKRKPFSLDVYLVGNAENLAEFIIAEFTTKGTVRNQDILRLYCTRSGNTDGITIVYNGNMQTLSFGFAKYSDVLEVELSQGLSNNNGYIEVHSNPGAYSPVQDKVFYTDDRKNSELYDSYWQGSGINVSKSSRKKSLVRKKDVNGVYIDSNRATDFEIKMQ